MANVIEGGFVDMIPNAPVINEEMAGFNAGGMVRGGFGSQAQPAVHFDGYGRQLSEQSGLSVGGPTLSAHHHHQHQQHHHQVGGTSLYNDYGQMGNGTTMGGQGVGGSLMNGDSRAIPDEVCEYLRYFKRCIMDQNVPEILNLYDFGFSDLTERYYREKFWPDEEKVRNVVDIDKESEIFIILYKELYYRYLYGKIQRGPSLEHRWHSFQNYQALFSYILTPVDPNSPSESIEERPVKLNLPSQWLWDIVDEFVYQFQSFCQFKTSVNKRSKEEIEDLKSMEDQLWNLYPVLNVLYSLISKSQINLQLKAANENEDIEHKLDEFGKHPLYYKLGYFGLIGLCRLHVLLGDYYQALKTIKNLTFNTQELYNTVPTCSLALHYYVGFCHMMARRYQDTVQLYVTCLMFIQRTRGLQYQQPQNKTWQYDIISKTVEQMYNLLSVCLILQPQRIDESIQSQLNEKMSDKMNRLARGELADFESAFLTGCPKFLMPMVPTYDTNLNYSKEPIALQCRVFMEEVKQQISIPVLRGYLKLYTSIPLAKLASFVELDEQELIYGLLAFKHKMYDLNRNEAINGSPEDDSTMDLDFYVDKDMINVADTKVARRYGEYFVKHIQKLMELNKMLIKVGSGQETIVGKRYRKVN